MTRRSGVLLLCLSLFVTACGSPWWIAFGTPPPTPTTSASPSPEPATPLPTEPPAAFGIADLAVGKRDTSPSVPAADLRALVDGNTAFALSLYRSIATAPDSVNIAVGPYSISTTLAMLEAGAAGKTR